MTSFRMCQWFVMCGNEATRTRHHPILGDVPICERCDDKIAAIEGEERKAVKAHVRLHYTDRFADSWISVEEMARLPRTIVFEGFVEHDGNEDATPEVCFSQFNRVGEGHYEHPALDAGGLRSMCTGDIVEIVGLDQNRFFLCRSLGFEEIEAAAMR